MDRVLVLAFLVSLLVGGCAGVQTKPISGSENVTADAPAIKAGDEWRYTGGYFIRVAGVEGDLVVTETNLDPYCARCRFIRDKNGTVVRVIDAEGKPVEYPLSGLRLLDFPLRVGKEWTQDLVLPQLSNGRMTPYSNTFKVEGYEEVSTKAGAFKAFRISWRQENRGPYGWRGTLEMWWSPEVRAFVKRAVYTPGWVRDFDLESYTVK
jgi:hypothetical protein